MFQMTISTRDYARFAVSGSHDDLRTAALIFQAGLQLSQCVSITIVAKNAEEHTAHFSNARHVAAFVAMILDKCAAPKFKDI